MKLFEVKKIVAAIVVILIMATTTFVFWQATPEEPASSNGSGNVIIGEDGTFATSISVDPIHEYEDNVRLVPKQLEGLIKAPDGVIWLYEIKLEFNISWVYEEELDSILGDQVFNGELEIEYNNDLVHDLIEVDFNKEPLSITANGDSVKVIVTITMNMPDSLEEYNEVNGKTIPMVFIASVKPDNNLDNSDKSLFIFE